MYRLLINGSGSWAGIDVTGTLPELTALLAASERLIPAWANPSIKRVG